MLEIGANLRDVLVAAIAASVSIVGYIVVKRQQANKRNLQRQSDDKPNRGNGPSPD